MGGRGAGHIEAAFEVYLDHGVEVFFGHLVKDTVAKIAGVVHYAIDSPIEIKRLLDDALSRVPFSDTVGIGGCRATESKDFIHGQLSWALADSAAVDRNSQIVNDYLGALSSRLQGNTFAHTVAGASNNDDFTFQKTCHLFAPLFFV
ncbi:hypothetical protein D3C80_1355730 [compost metagenome]